MSAIHGIERAPVQAASEPAPPPITAPELAGILDCTPEEAGRLLEVTVELVNRYAPLAPSAIRREAIIRTAGWLLETPTNGIRSQSVGPLSADYSPSMVSALRHSGSMALLSPWKIRRGGSIG